MIMTMSTQNIHPGHDVWGIISHFSDSNTTQQLRLVSHNNRIWIDNNFKKLVILINKYHSQNNNQTLFEIKHLISQYQILKSMLQSKPELFTKLLFPQIRNGAILTDNLKLNKDLNDSTDFIDHFYYHLTSIWHPRKRPSSRIYGRLFALKLLDNGFKHQLHCIKSVDILRLINKPRSNSKMYYDLIFDSGVFEIICDPRFYPSFESFGEDLYRSFRTYWHFKGIPQWFNSRLPHINWYRSNQRHSWRDTIIFHMEVLFDSWPELFDGQYIDNLFYFSELLSWIRNRLGFTVHDAMDPFIFRVFRQYVSVLPPNHTWASTVDNQAFIPFTPLS